MSTNCRRGLVVLAAFLSAAGIGSAGAAPPAAEERTAGRPAPAVQEAPPPPEARGLRDEAAMVLVGTALIGIAGAVRRAA